MGEKLLTAKEAAEILKVRKNTVYDMIKRGECCNSAFMAWKNEQLQYSVHQQYATGNRPCCFTSFKKKAGFLCAERKS